MSKCTPEEIDALLPQTQCGLCSYNGCMPYATALAKGETEINRCPPGGVSGLFALAELLDKDATPYLDEMEKKAKAASVAVIREAECIGCTKCIQTCPVDAILGTGKAMHTIIADECTGCELCIAPCPVDCIDMIAIHQTSDKKNQYKKRYFARNKRLAKKTVATQIPAIDKKTYIQEALMRAKLKKK